MKKEEPKSPKRFMEDASEEARKAAKLICKYVARVEWDDECPF